MIRIQQLKLPIRHTEADLKARILKKLGIREDALISYEIRKQSIDARKKPELFYVYTVDVNVRKEAALKKKKKQSDILFLEKEKPYRITTQNDRRPDERPVIIGMGPAGLFCGLELARLGFRPLILERGAAVEERMKDVDAESGFKRAVRRRRSGYVFRRETKHHGARQCGKRQVRSGAVREIWGSGRDPLAE